MSADPLHASPGKVACCKVKLTHTKSFPKPTMDSLSEECDEATSMSKSFIGVKNHLPSFYEKHKLVDCEELDRELGARQTKAARRCHRWCRLLLFAGIFLVLTGVLLVLVGYLLPRKEVVVEKQDSLEVRDKSAIDYNNFLEFSILLGVGLGCLGGSLAAVSLTVMSVIPGDDTTSDDLDCSSEQHILFTELVARGFVEDDGPRSPLEEKIPAIEHLRPVQPDWEKEKDGKHVNKLKNGVVFRF